MDTHMKIIVAVNSSHCIDFETTQDDRQRFAALTTDSRCVCGRKTWDTLPGLARRNRSWYVMTRNPNVQRQDGGPFYHHSSVESLSLLSDAPDLWVCGGGEIYQQAIPHASHLYLSRFLGHSGGSVRFPEVDPAEWEMLCSQTHPQHLFQILRRRYP